MLLAAFYDGLEKIPSKYGYDMKKGEADAVGQNWIPMKR